MATAKSKSRAQVDTVNGGGSGFASFGSALSMFVGSTEGKGKFNLTFILSEIVQATYFDRLASRRSHGSLSTSSTSYAPQDSLKCTKLHPTFYANCIFYRSSCARRAASKLAGERGEQVTIFTAAYRARFTQLASDVNLRWVPQFVPSIHFLTGVQLARPWQRADTALYDHLVAMRIGATRDHFDIFWAWASGALASGRAARHRGARFVLDRACPHVDAQQALIQTECERLSVPYQAEPSWFRARQLAEYDEADIILVPSTYSRATFPTALQSKTLVAPLFGRVPMPQVTIPSNAISVHQRTRTGVGCAVHLRYSRRTAVAQGIFIFATGVETTPTPQRSIVATHRCAARSIASTARIAAYLPNVEMVKYVDEHERFLPPLRCLCLPHDRRWLWHGVVGGDGSWAARDYDNTLWRRGIVYP